MKNYFKGIKFCEFRNFSLNLQNLKNSQSENYVLLNFYRIYGIYRILRNLVVANLLLPDLDLSSTMKVAKFLSSRKIDKETLSTRELSQIHNFFENNYPGHIYSSHPFYTGVFLWKNRPLKNCILLKRDTDVSNNCNIRLFVLDLNLGYIFVCLLTSNW